MANATFAQVAVGQAFPVNGAVRSALSSFSGEIREVRMWSTLASAGTISQNMSAALLGGESGLQHLITPTWQESATPYSGSQGNSFEVLDNATGSDVLGFGSASTTGQVPFRLSQRLTFSSELNWVEVPLAWNRSQPRPFEFWLSTRDVQTSQIILSAVTSSATNLQVGLVGRRLTLVQAGGSVLTWTGILAENSLHHVAISTANGIPGL